MIIREVKEKDIEELLNLYKYLKDSELPNKDEAMNVWRNIINSKDQHIIVAEKDKRLVSSCAVTVIQNLTHGHRPYAVIENVVTDEKYRKQGLATACLNYAKELAIKEKCYKLMLSTGSKRESTLKFYEMAGYNRKDKTAFVQWI